MRHHHALRVRRRAAGVEDHPEVFAAPIGVGHRRVSLDQVFVAEHARGHLALAHIDEGLHPGELRLEFARLVDKALVDEQDRGLRVGERVGVLGDRPADVERREGAAGPGDGEEQLDVAVRIERQRSHEGAVGDAERAQRGGQTRDPLADLLPGAPTRSRDGRRPSRLAVDRLRQEMRSLHRRIPRFGRLARSARPPLRSSGFRAQLTSCNQD